MVFDFEKMDEDIRGFVKGKDRATQIREIREIAEFHRCYASRAANMAREIHDERPTDVPQDYIYQR